MSSCPFVYFYKIWIFYNTIKCSVCLLNKELKPESVFDSGIGEALRNYFESKTNHLNIHVEFGTESSPGIQHELIERLTHVLYNSSKLTYSISVKKTLDQIKPTHYNLWYVDSYDAIRALFPVSELYYLNGIGSYVILLRTNEQQRQSPNYKTEIKKIFQVMFQRSIVNVVIFLRNTKGHIVAYSYQPFQPNQCNEIVPIQTNALTNGQLRHRELFPKKFQNFNNCTLRIFARNVGPFFIFNDTEMHPTTMYGIEAIALQTIAKKLNFQIELHGNPATLWGDVFRNGTITGPYLLLKQGIVDILMGYFSYTPTRVLHFSESLSYLGSDLMAFIKHTNDDAAEHACNWVVNPFRWTTWVCLLICIVLMISFIKLINSAYCRRFRNVLNIQENNHIWTDIVGSMLGVAQTTTVVQNSPIRFMIILWNMAFLVFGAAYHAKLFVSYSHEFMPTLSNVEELTFHNYTFLVRDTVDNALVMEELNISMANIRLVRESTPDYLFELVENSESHVATLSTYLRYLFYIKNREPFDIFSFVRMPLRFQQICAYFRRNSYLREVFNRILRRIREAGLIHKWFEVDVELQYRLLRRHDQIFLKNDEHLRPLGLEKFSLIFIGFLVCQFIALCVVLIEMLTYYLQQKQQQRARLNESKSYSKRMTIQ